MSRRGAVAVGVLLAWAAGLALFVYREAREGPARRLAEAALRVSPGAVYFRVEQGDRQIGFASSTIDTTAGGLQVVDHLIADLPIGGRAHRATVSSDIRLSRSLALTTFRFAYESDSAPIRISGRAAGDSLLEVVIGHDAAVADTQRVPLTGGVVLPTIVPLAVALGEVPEVGKSYTLSTFDPVGMSARPLTVRIEAESLFAVTDSAHFDGARRRWTGARIDSVRAWRLATDGPSGVRAWVDEQGRLVELHHALGFSLRRTAYEIAFENWRLDGGTRSTRVTADRDILETTAIAASAPIRRQHRDRVRVRLRGVDLTDFALRGGRQTLIGDTLVVSREPDSLLNAGYTLPLRLADRRRFRPHLLPEPLVQSTAPAIVKLAERLRGDARDPAVVARRINSWVHDSLRKSIAITVPSAVHVLKARSGDCNEHTQLFIALARAAGIPARAASGLAYVDGKFYYHAWPEVYLGSWVAVDPTFGQFPADAAHLRFVSGGLDRQVDLLRLIGALRIDLIDAN